MQGRLGCVMKAKYNLLILDEVILRPKACIMQQAHNRFLLIVAKKKERGLSFPITSGNSEGDKACPGIGIVISTPDAETEGKMALSLAAAAAAFGAPPPWQSSNSYRLCLTGLE